MDTRSPSTPYSAGSSQYKTNVNRTKTRKWVEAKVQSYDGDDWGAEDEFEDEDAAHDDQHQDSYFQQQPPMPQPARPGRLTAGLRAIGPGSGPSTPRSGSAGSSPSLRPSERIALEKQAGQRSVTGPPSLHIQTGVQPHQPVGEARPVAVSAQFPPRKSSMTSQDRPDLTDPVLWRPRTSSRPESPATGTGVRSPTSAAKVIRPSDIYRRMEEERERERRSIDSAKRPSLDSTGSRGVGGDGEVVESAVRSPGRPSVGRNDSAEGGRALQALAPVAERKSEYGFDGMTISPGGPAPPEQGAAGTDATKTLEAKPDPANVPSRRAPAPPPTTLHNLTLRDEPEHSQESGKRFSVSPKLPDLSRMSGFGSDFFGPSGNFMDEPHKPADAPAETQAPAAANHAQKDAAVVGDDKTPAQGNPADQPSGTQPPAPAEPKPFRPSLPGGWVSETASTPGELATPGGGSMLADINEHPGEPSLKPAPLRTPTPRSSIIRSDDDKGSSKSSHASPQTLPPLRAAPSVPSIAEDPARSSEDGPDETHASGVNLEAPAPLHPKKGSVPDLPAETLRQQVERTDTDMTADSSPVKESDVLRDEIIRSLSPTRLSNAYLDTMQGQDGGRESAYLSDVYDDYWNPEIEDPHQPKNVPSDPEPLPNKPEAEPDTAKPSLKRERFSWEAGAADADAGQHSPAEKAIHEPPPDLTSPVTPKGDSGRLSSSLALPSLKSAQNPSAATQESRPRVVSEVSLLGPGQDVQSIDPPSPDSQHIDLEIAEAVDRASKLLSQDQEIMSVQSPTSPMSPGLEADPPQPLRAMSPTADTPSEIPLPRSPSPVGPIADLNQQHYPNVMTLKEIMALPTSPERVYQMLEVRAEFAVMQSGLNHWLTEMLVRPEHELGGPTFNYPSGGGDVELLTSTKKRHSAGPGGHSAEGSGGPGHSYSGSASGLGSGPGSMRMASAANMNMQLDKLMHGQAGVKGKELLHSAGKMGKGLLSKGKNKLRERADKRA